MPDIIDQEKDLKKNINFLTGFRGFLAITVLLHHASYDLHLKEDYNLFKGLGYYVGVIGFFVLSSFLLTYRLILDLEQKENIKDMLKVLIFYFIRRICRVYMPFVLFCILLKWRQKIFGGYFVRYSSLKSLISLKNVGHNHLWTIANEVKYYFFIPILCSIYVFIGKNKKYLIYGLTFYLFIVEYFNIYGLKNSDHNPENRHSLTPRFNVFLAGSLMSMVFLNINLDHQFLKSKIFSIFFKILVTGSIIYFPYEFLQYLNPKVLHITHSTLSGVCISVFIFLLIIGPQDYFVTEWFSSSNFLLNCGKYSFGIYLFHPMCIKVDKLIKTKTHIEMIILVIFLSYFVGVVFYHLIEKNSIRLGNFLIKYSF